MSTHNLCFGSKIRRIGIPPHTPVLLYKIGVQGGILFMYMLSRCDVAHHLQSPLPCLQSVVHIKWRHAELFWIGMVDFWGPNFELSSCVFCVFF